MGIAICNVHPEDSGDDMDNLKLEMISYFIIWQCYSSWYCYSANSGTANINHPVHPAEIRYLTSHYLRQRKFPVIPYHTNFLPEERRFKVLYCNMFGQSFKNDSHNDNDNVNIGNRNQKRQRYRLGENLVLTETIFMEKNSIFAPVCCALQLMIGW